MGLAMLFTVQQQKRIVSQGAKKANNRNPYQSNQETLMLCLGQLLKTGCNHQCID